VALTPEFVADSGKQAQWTAFLRRTAIAMAPEPLRELIALIREFATPLLEDGAAAKMAAATWPAGGPWRRSED
jgi:hypothetical protein